MDKENIKNRIKSAAIKVISEKGYYGSRTSEIAVAAGCSEGSIFKHYGSKEKLLRSIIHDGAMIFLNEEFLVKTENFFKGIEDMEAKKFLEEFIRDRLDLIKNNREILKIVLIELNFHDGLKKEYIQLFKGIVLKYKKIILKHLGDKIRLKDLPDDDIITFVFGTLSGIIMRILVFNLDSLQYENMISNILDMFIDGISLED